MVQFEEISVKGVVFGDVNVTSVEDDSIFQVPVLESFGEGARATVQDGF